VRCRNRGNAAGWRELGISGLQKKLRIDFARRPSIRVRRGDLDMDQRALELIAELCVRAGALMEDRSADLVSAVPPDLAVLE
jgi:hypothetical protein